MKPDVDIVNLIAIQELADVNAPDINDYLNIGKANDILGKKITINQLAQIISTQLGSGSILPDRVYLIDGTMPVGSSLSPDRRQIIDPYLNNKVYSVHRRSIEWFIKGSEWDNTVPGGGIQLLRGSGTTLDPYDTFNTQEVIIVSFAPSFSPYIPTPDAIARFTNGEQIFSANGTITSAMFRKLIILQSATSILSINLPLSTDYPENVALYIISNGGNHKQATINAAGSEIIKGYGSQAFLGQKEQLCLIRSSGGWNVVYKTPENRIGTVDFGYLAGINQFAAITLTPQSRAEYPRIWDFIKKLAAQQPAAVVSNSQWQNNKGLWGLGDGDLITGTTFNFPYMPGQFMRFIDPTGTIDIDRFGTGIHNLPGSLEKEQFKSHTHRYNRTPGNVGRYVAHVSNGAYGFDNTYEQSEAIGGTETRPLNIAGIPLINI
ncbi:MAG: hypothetical protein WB562_19820 [Candidatus Sulfotelmatobacter sp.]